MLLVIVRHGIAEDRDEASQAGKADEERTLTAEGRRRMEEAAKGLKAVCPTIHRVASSPLVRAVETATIVANAYGTVPVEHAQCLAPGEGPDAVLQWLEGIGEAETVAVVGHEPDLSVLATYIVSGRAVSSVQLKKGAMALVEMPGSPRPGVGVLRWLLAPKHLRTLGASGA